MDQIWGFQTFGSCSVDFFYNGAPFTETGHIYVFVEILDFYRISAILGCFEFIGGNEIVVIFGQRNLKSSFPSAQYISIASHF